jgi:hypothetical protein
MVLAGAAGLSVTPREQVLGSYLEVLGAEQFDPKASASRSFVLNAAQTASASATCWCEKPADNTCPHVLGAHLLSFLGQLAEHQPQHGFAQNQVWCEIVALACELCHRHESDVSGRLNLLDRPADRPVVRAGADGKTAGAGRA